MKNCLKIFLCSLLILLTVAATAQTVTDINSNGEMHKRLGATLGMKMPVRDTVCDMLNKTCIGSYVIHPVDQYVYYRDSTKWVKLAKYSDIATIINNTNVGSGYRLLKPSTQEIKTLFGGYGVLLDSTTNANGITATLDTAAASTKAYALSLYDILNANKLNKSDTTGKWIWNQYTQRQDAKAWFKDLKLRTLLIGSEDSAFYPWMPDNLTGAWATLQGKLFQLQDIDTVTAANDDWPYAVNVNALVSRITRLVPDRLSGYRHNFNASQNYEASNNRTQGIYSLGGDAGSALYGRVHVTDKAGQNTGNKLINGGSVYFDGVPVLVAMLESSPKSEAVGTSTRRLGGYWTGINSYVNLANGDSIDHHVSYQIGRYYGDNTRFKSSTGFYNNIDQNATVIPLNWNMYSPDALSHSYNLFGGRVGIGGFGFGTHDAPTYHSSAALQINSNERGFITSRMTAAQRLAISSPDTALFVWDSDSSRFMGYTSGAWKGIAWTGEGGSGGGITSLNGLAGATQTFATGTSGTNFNISSSGTTHTFNIPDASNTNRGLVTNTAQSFSGLKTFNEGIIVNGNSEFRIGGNNSTSNLWAAGAASTFDNPVALFPSINIFSNRSFAGVLFKSPVVTESATGPHLLVSNAAFMPVDLNNGTATTTYGATVYIRGSATGTATITNNYAFWVDSGLVRIDDIPYNSGSEIVALGVDTLTGIIYRKTASGGGGGHTIRNEGSDLTARTGLNFIGSAVNVADDAGGNESEVTFDAEVNGIADLSTNGIVAKTGAGTFAGRTLTGTTNQINVTNGDGVSGNPTFAFPLAGVKIGQTNLDYEIAISGAGAVGQRIKGFEGQGANLFETRDYETSSLLFSHRPDGSVDILPTFQDWYQYYGDASGNTQSYFFMSSSGSGASFTRPATGIADGWLSGWKLSTGTTTTGFAYAYYGSGSGYAPITFTSSKRYNAGTKVRLEDLSTGTETYEYFFGFGDDANGTANIVDGAYFRYKHSDSSGAWIACTKSNSTLTEDALAVTVAADTDYELEVSVYNGEAKFYVNKVLYSTISTNIPSGTTRITSVVNVMHKLAGTTNRDAYVEWIGLGKRNN